LLSALKTEVKNDNRKWEKFFKKHLSHLFNKKHIRSAQRYMKLSNKIDLDTYPNLRFLGLTLLHHLVALAGKTDVSDYLADNNIKIDSEDDDEIDGFRWKVEKLIGSLKEEKKKKTKRTDEDGDDPEDDDHENDSVAAKSKKKPKSMTIVDRFRKTGTTFMKSIDSVMKSEKVVNHKRKVLDNTVKEVEEKLSDLKKYQKEFKKEKKSKKK